MKKIRAAVVGYGNIGHYTVQALEAAKDFEIAGIVRRNGQTVIPSGNDALQEGDDVVIVTTDTTLHSLRDIVK